MKNIIKTLLVAVLAICSTGLFAQGLVATVTIQNLEVQDNVLYFDMYLKSNQGTMYLGDADFVIDINTAAFANPVFSKTMNPSAVQLQFGYVGLLPETAQGGVADDAFRVAMFNNTSTELANNGKTLIVNFKGVAPQSVEAIQSNTPAVDVTEGIHRLGRFQVSGVVDADLAKQLSFESDYMVPSDAYGYTMGEAVKGEQVPLEFVIKNDNEDIEIPVIEASTYDIFPIPAISNATLDYNAISKDELNIQIMDVNGRVLINFTEDIRKGNNRIDLNLSKLTAGNYLIQMTELGAENISTDKLVVIKP